MYSHTNPNKKDSDDDGLDDNVEMETAYRCEQIRGTQCFKYYHKLVSDPSMPDTDGDGLLDGDEREKDSLHRGIGNGIVGKLTIVSCDNSPFGHAFFVYQSYIEKSLNLTMYTAGYDSKSYLRMDLQWYIITPDEYITIGNAGQDAEIEHIPQIKELRFTDYDTAGVYFNREIVYEYLNYKHNYDPDNPNDFKPAYDLNMAYSKEITEIELEQILERAIDHNYYDITFNNCAEVAVYTWNSVFVDDRFEEASILTPSNLKKQIVKKEGAYRFKMKDIIPELPERLS